MCKWQIATVKPLYVCESVIWVYKCDGLTTGIKEKLFSSVCTASIAIRGSRFAVCLVFWCIRSQKFVQ